MAANLRLAPGEKKVPPLPMAIASGLVIFLAICAIPLALGFLSYGLGMTGLAVLALAGLALSYRLGVLSMLVAIFVALLPAALVVGAADDVRTARRATVATITVADAPSHGAADLFVFDDARVATEFTVTWTTKPPAGGTDMHHAVAPLVASGWKPDAPVPAWRACTGGDAAWCARALAHPVRAARRLRDGEAARYRPGLATMTQRFGLQSHPARRCCSSPHHRPNAPKRL